VIKVLIVDDSALARKLFTAALTAQPDIEVAFARDGAEALEQVRSFRPDVITLDVHMPKMNGLECLDRIMVESPSPVVMVSSLTEVGAEETLEALRLGAVDFVAKPKGAFSLYMAEFAPVLVQKVRAAASAKLKGSTRLKDKVRHRIGAGRPPKYSAGAVARVPLSPVCAEGKGLVLIGVSTGGPPALDLLLSGLPPTFGWPVLIAQHMPATFTGPLARRLDSICSLQVQEVSGITRLRQGSVYVARGDADLVVSRRGGDLVAMPAPARAEYPWHPSADRLVRSAMEHVAPQQLVGVLLTGMGDDGAAAMTALNGAGGKTIAEAEETAVIWGMPGALVKAGAADWVLPLPDISGFLQRIVPSHAART
jgi:two-component system, chemotaxis family, protein-glutamate methylesterase/glutaminase